MFFAIVSVVLVPWLADPSQQHRIFRILNYTHCRADQRSLLDRSLWDGGTVKYPLYLIILQLVDSHDLTEYLSLVENLNRVHKYISMGKRKSFAHYQFAEMLHAVNSLLALRLALSSALNCAVGVLTRMPLVIRIAQERIADAYGSQFFLVVLGGRASRDLL